MESFATAAPNGWWWVEGERSISLPPLSLLLFIYSLNAEGLVFLNLTACHHPKATQKRPKRDFFLPLGRQILVWGWLGRERGRVMFFLRPFSKRKL